VEKEEGTGKKNSTHVLSEGIRKKYAILKQENMQVYVLEV
jgi:hypothetical protein